MKFPIFAAALLCSSSMLGAQDQRPATRLRSIAIEQRANGIVAVVIQADGALHAPESGVLAAPPRIFFDFPELLPAPKGAGGQDNRAVRQVRVALHSAAPRVTRVVIDLVQAMRAAVLRRPHSSLRIRFQHDAGQVRDGHVQGVHPRLPPLRHLWIQRIVGVELPERLRAAEIDRDRDAYTPWPEEIGNASDVWDQLVGDHAGVRIDAADGHRVDADGCEQAAVIRDARQIGPRAVVLPEDRPAAVPALDRAVHGPDRSSAFGTSDASGVRELELQRVTRRKVMARRWPG